MEAGGPFEGGRGAGPEPAGPPPVPTFDATPAPPAPPAPAFGAPPPGPPPPPPTPVPLPVTGYDPARDSRRRTWTAVAIVGAILVVVGAFSAAGYVVLGTLASGTVGLPALTPPPPKPSPLEAAFVHRAKVDYAGMTLVGVDSVMNSGTPESPGPERDVYLTFTDPAFDGFRFVVVYSGSVTATDSATFDNSDEFFLPADSASEPAASFKRMWMRTHAADTCDYVSELSDPTDVKRAFAVGFTPTADEVGGAQSTDVYFTYTGATDTWAESQTDPTVDPSSGTRADPTGGATASDSTPNTATAVAAAYPDFELQGVAQEPDGPWDEIIRNRAYPSVRLAVSIDGLAPNDPLDPLQVLFEADKSRAHAFLVMWSARHPGTIIESIDAAPNAMAESRLVDIFYSSGSAAAFGVDTNEAWVRYDAKTHTWVLVKTPGE